MFLTVSTSSLTSASYEHILKTAGCQIQNLIAPKWDLGFLHGGVVSSLLDGGMTDDLFTRGDSPRTWVQNSSRGNPGHRSRPIQESS